MNDTKNIQDQSSSFDFSKPINNCLFILFAEFFGYVSPLIDLAEDFCDGKEISSHMLSFLKIDSIMILEKMKKEFTIDELKDWYKKFYPLLLEQYDEKMKEKYDTKNSFNN